MDIAVIDCSVNNSSIGAVPGGGFAEPVPSDNDNISLAMGGTYAVIGECGHVGKALRMYILFRAQRYARPVVLNTARP